MRETSKTLSEIEWVKVHCNKFFSMSDYPAHNGRGRREVEVQRKLHLQPVVKRPATSAITAPQVRVVEENDEGVLRLAVRAAA